jgi:hypothetical protein
MSKIAEQKALEAYPILFSERNDYDNTFKDRRESYIKGYDQAMQDFLGWLKDCSTFTYSNGYKRIDDDLYNKLVEDFKNYMQDEI